PVRLVGGASRCEGTLEVNQGEWIPVDYDGMNLKGAADSIRLVNGSGLCSGRLEVRSNQSNQWSSVCEEDFDQQGAEVVCRELGCGAPSVLQGALYGEVEAPMWTKGFQCGGHESALLDCRSSGSERNTCSPGKAVGLTCSEPVRLVGGASRCEGTLEVKHQGEWRPVEYFGMNLKGADVACRDLDCGSAVSIRHRKESSKRSVWRIQSGCVQSGSAVRECITSTTSSSIVDLTCSDGPPPGSGNSRTGHSSSGQPHASAVASKASRYAWTSSPAVSRCSVSPANAAIPGAGGGWTNGWICSEPDGAPQEPGSRRGFSPQCRTAYVWRSTHHLKINLDKTEVLLFPRKDSPTQDLTVN
ncbi:scavenger receptor cysteine-rich type 1 protein M130-like, partial [Pungitius pungitius]|uniref:scavenger receptor cysteine-rich type 1 protein M130-like n=1 Tax=Pungitius pungitius TaxID=134920 RepID=UPI002E1375A0